MNEMNSLTLNGKTYDSFTDQTAREGLAKKIPFPGGATVGQYLQVEAVDEAGNVTKVKTVDAPSGGNPDSGASGISKTAAKLICTLFWNCPALSLEQAANIRALEAAFGLVEAPEGGVSEDGEILTIISGVEVTDDGGDMITFR